MATCALWRLVALSVLTVTAGEALPHGGTYRTYRGPGDTVPANPGGAGPTTPGPNVPGPSSPTTPGPTGPTNPGASGPTTPTPAGPTGPVTTGGGNGPSRGPTTGGGIALDDDLTRWQFWWEYNKDPFLKLKRAIYRNTVTTGSDDYFVGHNRRSDAVDTLRPGPKEIATKVVPRLIQAVEGKSTQRDITSSCLVALARIGMEEERVLALMKARLPDGDQEVSETAAVAMGILASPKAVADLHALLADTPAGRALCQRTNGVPFRTRSFAAYGLGLIAWAHDDVDLKEQVYLALKPVVEADRLSGRDLRIAAIQGLRLLRIDPAAGPKAAALLDRTLATLMGFYDARRPNEEQSQAHVPVAIARLLGRDQALGASYSKRWLKDLNEGKKSDWIRQSCALALGAMGQPDDAACRKELSTYFQKGRDLQARYFALMALGMIGGEANRAFLMGVLEDGKKLDKAWAALGLGVMNYRLREADPNVEVDSAAGLAVCRQLKDNRNPEVLGGLCIALGLLGHTQGADAILAVLRANTREDELSGYCCLALGLLQHRAARTEIRELVEESLRRPDRLKRAAIGLALLGDPGGVDLLVRFLKDNQSLAAVSATASALGFIGDARSLDPLLGVFEDAKLTDLARAFGAVALGLVTDKEEFPWNSKIATDLNYRANTETLTDSASGSGILDIL
jgi:HEAT repeat protein